MEKNYYDMLGVSRNASKEEIRNAFNSIVNKNYPDGFAEEDPTKEREFRELLNAAETLCDDEKRAEYDKTLKPVKNLKVNKKSKGFFKKHGGKIKLASLVLAAVFAGYLIGNKTNNSGKSRNAEPTVTPISSTVPVEEVPEVVVEEKLLNANNIEQKTQEILEDNKAKGLNVDPTIIRSALFVSNIDYLDQDDIKTMWENKDLNMIEEIQNMYSYASNVGQHDITNGEYVSLVPLVYDEQDKKIISEIDKEFQSLRKKLNDGTMTDEEFQRSFKLITEFYMGNGKITDENYQNYSLTNGGGLLSEQYWYWFAELYRDARYVTSENKTIIKALTEGSQESPAVVNGSKYLGEIINHESLKCLEEEKTLTKTQ